MTKLVLIRHGQSVWNQMDLFTGWTDVDLSPQGVEEARQAGEKLKASGFDFDCCHTSVLKRAIKTSNLALEAMDRLWLPQHKNWRLNERHYGGLQGLNKTETAAKHGADQVKIWRRSYDIAPPALEEGDERLPDGDARYAGMPKAHLPRTESLKDCVARVVPYWVHVVAPQVKAGQRVLIAAHGNSLRGLVKYLSDMSDEDIVQFEIPTGKPIVYELDADLKALDRYFLD
ncbi:MULTISPECIES: 2,3-diphosphoglycerate-dependent phosphoglycerate mutase [unclassified Azospirillum]|uniref:2,3-diphosphoglycerate-dependent phosphoglycerate mutase n=1 Tax=unclassified Azospirillum TaxID=2630922 RepID=UPI000B677FC9|nr:MULTISPECIES: 2,3-diphosphoglycerate-dependent phosphoglycerate mutase [unclassified Azospirillum]SNS21967.1 2,3-bisphosphoglycerate-dependent phosphoglycerate mutase [Azospirillum sp. RU38E]SNS39930.1 2,3-bisphosphoglycerate-dependent phosphoglycerate mutase [Azospirillum sp. RU37A]